MLNIQTTMQPGYIEQWPSLAGASSTLAIYEAALQNSSPTLVITPDNLSTNLLQQELEFFLREQNIPLIIFPDWETLPYDNFSPHQDIVSARLKALATLPNLKRSIVITSISTLMQRLPPKNYITSNNLSLQKNQEIDLTKFRNKLISNGYILVQQVLEHGEFAVRGSIIDIYPTGCELPLRIDLFDNEIDTIREFDPETQRSKTPIESIDLLPARECPLTSDAIANFTENWSKQFAHVNDNCPIYQNVSTGKSFPGIEYYLPLFFATTTTLFDYLSSKTFCIRYHNLHHAATQFWQEINERYEQLRYDRLHPILAPQKIFLTVDQLFGQLKQLPQAQLDGNNLNKDNALTICLNTEKLPDISISHKAKPPLTKLQNFINDQSGKILFCAESAGRRELLSDLFHEIGLKLTPIDSWQQFLTTEPQLTITVNQLQQGFCSNNTTIITETEIFGPQTTQQHSRKQQKTNPDAMIRDLTELKVGDPIVHIAHGIGKYLGLQTIKSQDREADYLTIEYANEAKLYIPIASLHLVSRYLGANPENIQYNHLGTNQWQKAKRKAAEQIRDTAAELLAIHAQRAAKTGYKFEPAKQQYQLFAAEFPFEATIDQQRAINDVLSDMTQPISMDRLVCGDVGFGKTEVAMRAAFVAAQNSKQVVILVPTTLLAQQHYENFCDRFADWPINVALLSRFITPKEQQITIENLKNGKVDVIIGTHKLLQQDVKFKELGLLIIDEEHRFGVRQKEKIKALRSNIDILTLTATPIPRTLSMSLAGVRDLSIIATPPERRLAIKTFIKEYNKQLIREAILREILRGGQVYFLHNDVATIAAIADELQLLLPEARIAIAHGQMREKQLEQTMNDFYHLHYNLLVCTTIIESGIDIPTANTIIINRADRFGLAQLHQLRGRVGRSHHQAYAYLIAPPKKNLTRDAKKRLEIFECMEDLGAGFTLATHDLEIRGAGEILGEQQSGQIQAIGYNLYMELLDKAVKTLKSGKTFSAETELSTSSGPDIDLAIPTLLPDTYVANVNTRLTLYKRISNATTKTELRDLQIELIDRFGLLPPATKNLFAITKLKLLANVLGVIKIKFGATQGQIEFQKQANIDPTKLLQLLKTCPSKYRFAGPEKINITLDSNEPEQKLAQLTKLLGTGVTNATFTSLTD